MIPGQNNTFLQYHRTTVTIVKQFRVWRNLTVHRSGSIRIFINQTEFESRCRAQNFLGPRGILNTRQLNNNTCRTLTLNQWLCHTQFVHTVTNNGDVLFQRIFRYGFLFGLRHGRLNPELTFIFIISESQINMAFTQMRQPFLLSIAVTESNNNITTGTTNTSITNAVFTQRGTEVLNQLFLRLAERFVHIHFHQEVHTTAQVKTQFQWACANGCQPFRCGGSQVQRRNKFVAQCLCNQLSGLQLIIGIIEADQYLVVFQYCAFDGNFCAIQRCFYRIQSFGLYIMATNC